MPFVKKAKPEDAPEMAPDTPLTLTVAQLQQLLGANQANGIDKESLAEIMARTAEMSAEAMRRSLKPENSFHPGISAFSYPEGDHLKPKPDLPCELLWNGFPVHKEMSVVHWWEAEEYAKLQPGEYVCTLMDRSTLPVTVEAQRSTDGKTITRLSVTFKATRDNKSKIPSPYIFCYQMNHPEMDARESFLEAMSKLLTLQLEDVRRKDARLAS